MRTRGKSLAENERARSPVQRLRRRSGQTDNQYIQLRLLKRIGELRLLLRRKLFQLRPLRDCDTYLETVIKKMPELPASFLLVVYDSVGLFYGRFQ
jgi:hypothetical protein